VGPNEGTYLNALRHDCGMNDSGEAPATPETEPGVMSSLPKTRPQRPSARRASARQAAAARSSAKADGVAPARPSRAKTARKKRPAVKAEPERAPRQGFEAESEIETGKAVAPPNGVELAASVVELLGELAQSGLRSGERLLRDALLRRPGS
jgi:hypothetical protein